MSSGGWEVVGRNKKDKTNGKTNGKLTKTEKKKFIENAPKLEDFLPLSQVKTIFENLDGEKIKKVKEPKPKENEEKKKPQKQNHAKESEGKNSKPKEKPAKIVEKNTGITAQQITEILDTNKARFPDAPLIWLKDLVAYLNKKLPSEKDDPLFYSKPDTYPLSLVSKQIRTIFEKVIKSSGPGNIQLFYEGTIVLMTKLLSENSPDMGCKIFLQLLGQMYPEMTLSYINKFISLKNSYQNKKTIGLSLLWAFSQSGKKNLTIGLNVWHEVMAPMLESRTYAFHVIKILKELIIVHQDSNALTGEMFIDIVDDFYAGKFNVVPTLSKEISSCMKILTDAAMKSNKIDLESVFATLMKKITPKTSQSFKEELVRILAACVVADIRCISMWNSIFMERVYQSELLLTLFNNDWYDFCTKLSVNSINIIKGFMGVILCEEEFEGKTNKEEAILKSCRKIAQELTKKMTASKKKDTSFPWKKGSIFLILFIGTVVLFDCKKHGSFQASNTARLLSNSGATAYGQRAWSMTQIYTNKGLSYLEASSPVYYKYAADLTKQYSKLAKDFYLVGSNGVARVYKNFVVYVEEKLPLAILTIEAYFPGWLDTFRKFGETSLESIKEFSGKFADHVGEWSTTFIRWMETSVFVGKLSPENIQQYAKQAVDSTQLFASQMYDWVYEKVQTLSKVQ